MALTISGSGGGITREDMDSWVTLDTWHIVKSNFSSTSSSYTTTILLTNERMRDVPGIDDYLFVRVRIKSGTLTYRGNGSGAKGAIGFSVSTGGYGYNNSYNFGMLLNPPVADYGTPYTKTFDGSDCVIATYAGSLSPRSGGGENSNFSTCGICYFIKNISSGSVDMQIAIEGKIKL